MKLKHEVSHFIENFRWESKEQKEGFLHLLQWSRKIPYDVLTANYEPFLVAVFLIQKNHEAYEWWAEVVADQITRLQREAIVQREAAAAGLAAVESRLTGEIAALKKALTKLETAAHP